MGASHMTAVLRPSRLLRRLAGSAVVLLAATITAPVHTAAADSEVAVHGVAAPESPERLNLGAWGSSFNGQDRIPRDAEPARAVAAGDGFSLALRRDGTVEAFGQMYGLHPTYPPRGLRDVRAMAAWKEHVL